MDERSVRRFRFGAWAFLAYTVAVIAWGAYVRVSFSGDGCGDHWPLCQGTVIPDNLGTKTIIEATHRLTSGLCLVFTVLLVVAARRVFPEGHAARRAAGWSLFFMVTEALLGAGLVLFRMVAENASIARGYWTALHLGNTFALLFAIGRACVAAHGAGRLVVAGRGRDAARYGGGFAGLLLVGMTGAVAALGDTLFPAQSFGAGFVQDFDPASHPFLQLRAFHPLFALGCGAYLLFVAATTIGAGATGAVRRAAFAVVGLVLAQIGLGFVNLALLAPAWMQLVHLVFADAVWVGWVVFVSWVLDERAEAHGAIAPLAA